MASIYKRGRSWALSWQQDGRQYRVSLGEITRAQAEIHLKAKDVELATGQQLLSTAIGFVEYSAEYLAWHEAEFPESHFRIRGIVNDHLIPFFAHTTLDRIEPRLVEAYKASRRHLVKGVTLQKELRTLNAAMNKAVEWKLLPENPIRHMRQQKPTDSRPAHWFTSEQLQAIYRADLAHAPVWRLLANTGLRRAEAQALKWSAVNGDSIHVLSSVGARTKSGLWRDVPLSPGAREALRVLKGGEYVLPRMTPPSLSRAFSHALDRAGIAEGSLHSLRHTFGTTLVMQGVPLRTIQVLMGHSTIRVTEQYAHMAPSYMADSVKALNL